MRIAHACSIAAALLACACTNPESGTLRPQLEFRISTETGLRNARDLTVDRAGNVFVFDYDEYFIRRYDSAGTLLATFGGVGDQPGRFEHLMAIRAHGDSLLALDAGSVALFDLAGNLRARRSLADTVVCDHPRLHPDGRWAAACFVSAAAEHTLTYRRADGSEARTVASYSLGEVFPGVEPGELFYVNPTQARTYRYDFTSDGRLVWLTSDRLRVLMDRDGVDVTLFEAAATAVPYPEDEIAAMAERQAGLRPPLFMNVPDRFQLVQHLVVAESGEVWLYLTSQERTGLLRLSETGREAGFYAVAADFDLLSARLTTANGRLYFMVPSSAETALYSVALP
jgi:hypothetical protein